VARRWSAGGWRARRWSAGGRARRGQASQRASAREEQERQPGRWREQMFESRGEASVRRQERQPGRRGERMFWSRAGTDERKRSEKGNQGDGENECSGHAPAQTSARGARRATKATGRTNVRVARGRQQAGATRGNAHEARKAQAREQRSTACAHPARPMGGSALNPRSAGAKRAHGAGAGVASSLQCRYYDQQPGKSAGNIGQNTRSVVVVAP